jgi:hypothetical protein
MIAERWMVVRRSGTIPGGYRVISHGLTEQEAIKLAAWYSTPSEAISESRLLQVRTDALAEASDA